MTVTKYVIPAEHVRRLRGIYLQSLHSMEEVGSRFHARSITSNCIELHVLDPDDEHVQRFESLFSSRDSSSNGNDDDDDNVLQQDKKGSNGTETGVVTKRSGGRSVHDGTAYGGYTLCEFNDDHPFTFHTHPIEADKRGRPINMPNLVSNEDMIGVVQDNVHNTGYLSNVNGRNVFDVLCCPIGIFVYAPEMTMIHKWIELEDEVNERNVLRLIKMFDPKFTSRQMAKIGVQRTIEHCKCLIQTDRSESNDFWATEENALMNSGFNEYIGSWYYTNRKRGFFHEEIVSHFDTLGYQVWHSKSCKHQLTEHERANLSVKEQIAWFTSDEFMAVDWHRVPMLRRYLSRMRSEGFFIEFFNWSSIDSGIEFLL